MKATLRSFVAIAFVLLTGIANAETWPTRPIKFVVPFGPGIGIDIMARTVGERLSRKLGQPVIIENIPGAGNILGAQAVARAAPDGYTFLFSGPSPVVTNIFLFKSLPYDPYRDFAAVAMISDRGPFVISVNPAVPVSTLPELIAYARARPRELHYAIDGSAIFQSVVGQYFAKRAGTNAALAESGKLRRIAITSKQRFPGLDDLPTVGETIPGFHIEGYIPLLAPAGLPADIMQRMNKEIGEILEEPEVLKRFEVFGYATSGAGTPESVEEHIRADRTFWTGLTKELALQPK